MGELIYKHGDLIKDSTVNVICHQVNCQGVMGAGIAKEIHELFPRVYMDYAILCSLAKRDSVSLMGKCQLLFTDDSHSRIVANLFGQNMYGIHKRQTDYDALTRAVHSLATNKYLLDNQLTLGFPYLIGCGLGGGNWDIVLDIIQNELKDYPKDIEIWQL